MVKKLLLVVLLLGLPCWAAPAFVNHAEGTNQSASTFTSLATAALNATAGNFITVCVRQATDATVPSSVTDTAGNTYTHVVGADSNETATDLLSIWYAFNITGNASNVVTAHWAAGHAFNAVLARQYSGILTTDPIDAKAFNGLNDGGATSITSSSFTTAQASELIVACGSSNSTGQTFTLGTIGGVSATNLFADGAAGSMMAMGEDLIVSSIQTGITASWNGNSQTQREISVATFKAAAGGAACADSHMMGVWRC